MPAKGATDPMLQAPSSPGARSTRAVAVQNVTRTFRARGRAVPALDGMSLTAQTGEIVAVVGPSGCGKTTLLELICALQVADAGVCEALPAALMPQRDLLLPWASALDNVALALRLHGASAAQAR